MFDPIDRKIIIATQKGLPLTVTPYHTLAEELEMEVGNLLEKIKNLQEKGAIRRIAAVPNHYRIGYKANGMSVWNVPDEKVDELGEKVGKLEFVSHCYQRPRYIPQWPYNLFAMVHGGSKEEALSYAEQIKSILQPDLKEHDILFSSKILKKTGFRLREE